MKLDNFPVIKLFILSYNLCYANNEIQIDNEDSILSSENTTVFSKIYPPFIITRRISDNVFDILSAPMQPNTDEENPTVEYIYFCPIESMKDLLKNDQLCRDMQCLFYIDSINVYKDNIRCESEIIPITQTYSGIEIVNHILNSVSVKIVVRVGSERARGFTQVIDWVSQKLFQPIAVECKETLHISQEDCERLSYNVWNVPLYFFAVGKNTLQTLYTAHEILPIPPLPDMGSTKSVSYITEQEVATLRKDYYTNFDLELSYHTYNKGLRPENNNKSEMVPQLLVPEADFSYELWKKCTKMNVNLTQLPKEFAERWNKTSKLLRYASWVSNLFNARLIVHTGVLNEIPKKSSDNSTQNLLHLIRTSYDFLTDNENNVSTPIPKIWYRIVGFWDSNDSLIILLTSHPTEVLLNIKTCLPLVDTRWHEIFQNSNDLTMNGNMKFCSLNVDMYFNRSENHSILVNNVLLNPDFDIFENIF